MSLYHLYFELDFEWHYQLIYMMSQWQNAMLDLTCNLSYCKINK
jgi:hypothetical protein